MKNCKNHKKDDITHHHVAFININVMLSNITCYNSVVFDPSLLTLWIINCVLEIYICYFITKDHYAPAHQILLKLVYLFLRYRDLFDFCDGSCCHVGFWKLQNFIDWRR